jgi:hypothetical protein
MVYISDERQVVACIYGPAAFIVLMVLFFAF